MMMLETSGWGYLLKMINKNINIMENNNYWKLGMIFSFLIVFSSFSVLALSIGNPSAVNGEPGVGVSSGVTLMNLGQGAKDVTVEIVVEEGGEYISFPDGLIYDVSAGTMLPVKINANIPSNAKIGDSFPVTIVFRPINGGGVTGEGTVSLAFGYRVSFNVNVIGAEGESELTKPTNEAGINVWWYVLAVIVIILIVWWWIMKKGKKSNMVGNVNHVVGKKK